MIVIVDYGLGNLNSIKNMFDHIGVSSTISNNSEQISKSNKLVLPGVGSFDMGMANLHSSGLTEVIQLEVCDKMKPVLGICLGMQLMTECSEEGHQQGLGWFKAKCKKFNFSSETCLKVPHMGWNVVQPLRYNSLFQGMTEEEIRYYFVHSYFVECAEKNDVLAQSSYGGNFACAIQRDNIFGVQFHPEKSHKFGMKLLKNFAEM